MWVSKNGEVDTLTQCDAMQPDAPTVGEREMGEIGEKGEEIREIGEEMGEEMGEMGEIVLTKGGGCSNGGEMVAISKAGQPLRRTSSAMRYVSKHCVANALLRGSSLVIVDVRSCHRAGEGAHHVVSKHLLPSMKHGSSLVLVDVRRPYEYAGGAHQRCAASRLA